MPTRTVLAVLLAGALLSSCTIIDLRAGEGRGVIHSDALISGFVDAGWTDNDSILRLSVLQDGLLGFNLWKLLRLEVGLVGLSLGVGPFDAGFGVLFYDARPPNYRWTLGGDEIAGYDERDHDDGPDVHVHVDVHDGHDHDEHGDHD